MHVTLERPFFGSALEQLTKSPKHQQSSVWTYPPKSPVARSATLAKQGYRRAQSTGITVFTDPLVLIYRRAVDRLNFLCGNTTDDSQPGEFPYLMGLHILSLCKTRKTLPTMINATDDESLLFEFIFKTSSFSIDIYNSGEIVFLSRVDGEMKVAEEVTFSHLQDVVSTISHAYERECLR
jgi:hypothetical protein